MYLSPSPTAGTTDTSGDPLASTDVTKPTRPTSFLTPSSALNSRLHELEAAGFGPLLSSRLNAAATLSWMFRGLTILSMTMFSLSLLAVSLLICSLLGRTCQRMVRAAWKEERREEDAREM
jgi:hypothetical protein